jgi:uncharacterized OsmC-like protein
MAWYWPEIDKYEDQIEMSVSFEGNLTSHERDKLFSISLHCPVHKMLKSGIKVKSVALHATE